MTENFGIAASALSVAALFNNCVEAIEYIQLGHHFGEEYQRCQLKLDTAETRLSRWGEAVRVNHDIRFASTSPTDNAVKDAQEAFEEIAGCFEAAQKKSRRYAERSDKKDLTVYTSNDMNPLFQQLHKRARDIARQRQNGMSLVKKAAWALYEEKSLERIIDQISSSVGELEKLFPIEATYRKCIDMEVAELNDELSLKTIRDVAHGVDPALEDAVKHKVNAIEGKNSARNVKMEDEARFQVGDVFSEGVLQRGILIKDQTTNSIETVSAKNRARVQIGNVYGGKGIWDD